MFGLGVWDIIIIIGIILVIIFIALYFLNRWAGKRMADQQEAVERNKQTVTIYVIDKKKDKITNANFPKMVYEQIPKVTKLMKMPLVKAKIGPQIMTLMCESKVYNALPVKKSVKVELAGMYIVGMKGLKTKKEMADMKKARKQTQAGGETTPASPLNRIRDKLFKR